MRYALHPDCAYLQHASAGHWLPLERKVEHIEVIRAWLESKEL